MDCQAYRIVEVDDIPGGHEWMLIDQPYEVAFVVKRGCWSARVVAEGWAAYRKVMRKRGRPSRPLLRAV